MYSPGGHVIYRQARGRLNAKLHPGLHMGDGRRKCGHVLNKVTLIFKLPFFLGATCIRLKF